MSAPANSPTPTAADATSAASEWQSDGPFFIGQFPLTVDDKGRLLIPSDVRKELDEERDGKGFIIITGANGKLWMYPEAFYKKHVAPRSIDPVPDPDQLAYSLMLFSSAARLVPDKAGRVLLPDNAVDREALGKDVVLIGAKEHLQLWRRDEWDEYRRQQQARIPELAQRYKAASRG